MISNLKELKQDPSNLDLLFYTQKQLLKKLTYIENKISKLNSEIKLLNKSIKLGRSSKESAKKLKVRKEVIRAKIQQYYWLLYVFRTIGDGIVFLYIDKWNIRPLAYKTSSPEYKETSGFISGKAGLKYEIITLTSAIEFGIPAILTDLTNCIRHGDICLLGTSIPKLIEVKSSYPKSKRVARQLDSIKQIQHYLTKDEANDFQGYSLRKRLDYHSQEISHVKVANKLIDKALTDGFACMEVEDGVFYFAKTADTDLQKLPLNLLKKYGEEDIQIFYYLNTLKNEEGWIEYFPFTLSIEKPENVYSFIVGDIQFLVFLSSLAIQNYATKMGFTTEISTEKGIIEFFDIKTDTRVGLTSDFLDRATYDFTSLKWILDETFFQHKNTLNKHPDF